MISDLTVLFPEIVLLSLTCIVLIADLFLSKRCEGITYWLSQATIIVTMLCCIFPFSTQLTAFNDQFIVDPFSLVLKVVILGLVGMVFLYSRAYTQARTMAFAEFHTLALFSTLGMMILVSSQTFLIMYLGLELLSLPLYALVALRRDSALSVEAGMKYFLMGALASGLFLYGISLLFGISGSVQLHNVSDFLQNIQDPGIRGIGLFALVFVIIGALFKLGAVPFHMWLPDVYEGSPTNVTLLVASAPKIAAFGMLYRLLNEALVTYAIQWKPLFIGFAILSLIIGNTVAIMQTNVKRLFAYSTIAHVGYLLLGVLVAPTVGYAPALYYMIVYVIGITAGLGVLLLLSQRSVEVETLGDLRGLAQHHPWIALILLIVAFSLAGVPPTVGFYAKLMILSALVDSGMTALAGVAVFFSVIGAFYYIKLVRVMYFEAPASPGGLMVGQRDFRVALSVNGIAIVGLGIFPAPLFMLCQQVLGSILR